jgi:hypothetical protein
VSRRPRRRAEPGASHPVVRHVLEIVADNDSALARGYLAILAHPPALDGSDPHAAKREAAIQTLLQFTASAYPLSERAAVDPSLRRLPRRRKLERAAKREMWRVQDAVVAGWMAGSLTAGRADGRRRTPSVRTAAARFLDLGSPGAAYSIGDDAVASLVSREWSRARPVAHLAVLLLPFMDGATARDSTTGKEGPVWLWRLLQDPTWAAPALALAEIHRVRIEERVPSLRGKLARVTWVKPEN